MMSFGFSTLPGRPRRAHRLTSAALGTGGQIEQAFDGEVLDFSATEVVVVQRIFEVDAVIAGVHRQQRAERVGLAGEVDVERRGDDVQVLRVGDEHAEREDDDKLREHEERFDAVVGRAEWVQGARHQPRRERPSVRPVREVAGVHLRAAIEQQRRDDREDHAEDRPRGAGV